MDIANIEKEDVIKFYKKYRKAFFLSFGFMFILAAAFLLYRYTNRIPLLPDKVTRIISQADRLTDQRVTVIGRLVASFNSAATHCMTGECGCSQSWSEFYLVDERASTTSVDATQAIRVPFTGCKGDGCSMICQPYTPIANQLYVFTGRLTKQADASGLSGYVLEDIDDARSYAIPNSKFFWWLNRQPLQANATSLAADSFSFTNQLPAYTAVLHDTAVVDGSRTVVVDQQYEIISDIFELQYPVENGALAFSLFEGSGTQVYMQLRAAPSYELVEQLPFTGPGGDTGTYYTRSNSAFWAGLNGNRYIQYHLYLINRSGIPMQVNFQVALVTSPQRFGYFKIDWDETTGWNSGMAKDIMVTLFDPYHHNLPLNAELNVYVITSDGLLQTPASPSHISMINGEGYGSLAVKRAANNALLCVGLGNAMQTCRPILNIVTYDISVIQIHVSPLALNDKGVAELRSNGLLLVDLSVVDMYGNVDINFAGDIACEPRVTEGRYEPVLAASIDETNQGRLQAAITLKLPAGDYALVCYLSSNPEINGSINVRITN